MKGTRGRARGGEVQANRVLDTLRILKEELEVRCDIAWSFHVALAF